MLSSHTNLSLFNRLYFLNRHQFSLELYIFLHRLQLVEKDLPAAYANWTERQTQRDAVRNSLVAEMKDKSTPFIEVCNSVSLLWSSINPIIDLPILYLFLKFLEKFLVP